MTHARAYAALAAAAALGFSAAAAVAAPVMPALPAPIVLRIPDTVLRTALALDPAAPVARGEFATPVRVAADRAALRASIERERAAQAERFASGAGPAIVVQLRRSRY